MDRLDNFILISKLSNSIEFTNKIGNDLLNTAVFESLSVVVTKGAKLLTEILAIG